MYGNSVDGFELYSEEAYQALRDVYLGLRPAPDGSHGCRPVLAAQRPLVLYGSCRMTGISREFKTFAGEWLGRTNYRQLLRPENTFKGKSSDGGIVWQTEDDVSPSGVYHTESYLDYFLWYHRNLAEKVLLNGTWWDNGSLDYGGPAALGLSYVRDDGTVQGRSNLFAWRQQTQRLNVMHWRVGRPPLYISNMHPLTSFTQVGWHIENSFYAFGGDTYPERIGPNAGVDVFRALVKSKPDIVSRFAYGRGRVGIAMCLLHDIGSAGVAPWQAGPYQEQQKILGILEAQMRLLSGSPRFIPYWRSQKVVAHSTPQVYASLYVHDPLAPWMGGNPPKRPAAVVVLFNGNGAETAVQDLDVEPKACGLAKVSRLWDGETGLDIPLSYSPAKGYRFGEDAPQQIHLPPHDFRLLVVE
jgi:hypothetical protein